MLPFSYYNFLSCSIPLGFLRHVSLLFCLRFSLYSDKYRRNKKVLPLQNSYSEIHDFCYEREEGKMENALDSRSSTSCAKLRILKIIIFLTLFMHVISLLYTGLSWLRLITTFAIATNNPQAVVTN